MNSVMVFTNWSDKMMYDLMCVMILTSVFLAFALYLKVRNIICNFKNKKRGK